MGILADVLDKISDVLFERINSQDLDDATKQSIKKRMVLTILISSILLAPAYFYALGMFFGVKPKEHMQFLQGNDPYKERYALLQEHLDKVNGEINKYERLSLNRQKVLFASLEVNIKDTGERTAALKIVNRTQDIITKLMELGKFYSVLVKDGLQTEETQEALLLMYEGWLDILKSENPRDASKAISDANDKYMKVYNEYLDHFPEPLRNDVKIEVLNVLTYCSARKHYPERSKQYLGEAKELLSESTISPVEYRRKYYWINFAEFIDAVNHLEEKKASAAFNTLNRRLNDPEFLRAKLLQHSGILTQLDQKAMIDRYLSSLF